MKKLLKYILLGILALVLYDSGKDDSPCKENFLHGEFPIENIIEEDTYLSSPQNDICLPRQISTLTVPRAQANGRHDNSNRQNQDFVKSCKVSSSKLNPLFQDNTLILYSSLTDPSHILVRLCRLII